MANLNLSEYPGLKYEGGAFISAQTLPAINKQSLPFTATSSQSALFSEATAMIRVLSDVDCYIEVGVTPTAVTLTGLRVAAGVPEYFVIQSPGLRLAVVA